MQLKENKVLDTATCYTLPAFHYNLLTLIFIKTKKMGKSCREMENKGQGKEINNYKVTKSEY